MASARSGCRSTVDLVADRCRQHVHGARLEPGGGDHRIAANHLAAGAECHVLQWYPGELLGEVLGPVHECTAVGGAQRAHVETRCSEVRYPPSVGADSRPAGSAQGEHGDIAAGDDDRARCRLEPVVLRVDGAIGCGGPAEPAVADVHAHTLQLQTRQPGAQQRRGSQRGGEHAAAGPHVGGLTELGAPRTQLGGGECLHGIAHERGRAVALDEPVERFAVGEVQPAAPGQQQLAAHRGHVLVDIDLQAGGRKHLRCHQPGGAAADHRGRAGDGRGRRHASRLRATPPGHPTNRSTASVGAVQTQVAVGAAAAYGPWRSSVPDVPGATPDLGVAVTANEEATRSAPVPVQMSEWPALADAVSNQPIGFE